MNQLVHYAFKRNRGRLILAAIVLYVGLTSLDLIAKTKQKLDIDPATVQRLVQKNESDFPIAVNQSVLRRLKFLLTRPEQAVGIKEELARMKKYQPMIQERLKKHDMPVELAAIPFVETGYQNIKSQGIGEISPSTTRFFSFCLPPNQDAY